MEKKKTELRDYQQECIDIIDNLKGGSHLAAMATGLGKCFAKGTPILMYDGSIRPVETIKENELVMGWDSKPRRVVNVTHGKEKMYRIERPKHEPYEVNESHVLSLKVSGLSEINKKTVYDSLGRKFHEDEICNIEVKDYLKCSDCFKHIAKGFCKEVDFNEYPLLVDPYFLGIWLCNGSLKKLDFRVSNKEIVDYLNSFADKHNMILKKAKNYNSDKNIVLSLSSNYRKANIGLYFEKNLFSNKHIPGEYLVNSKKNRLELLAGLLDANGFLNKKNSKTFEFHTKSFEFQQQVAFLCRTLGFTAKCFTEINKKYGRKYYCISITGDTETIPNKVKNKQAKQTLQTKNNLLHEIRVLPVDVDDYYGFELEGTDRMFLLGDCTVVHNTVTFSNIKRKGRVLLLSHRDELVHQPEKYYDCSFGVEQAGEHSNGEEVVSASVQTLVRRLDRFKPGEFDMIITDEAHHAAASSYKRIYEYLKPRLHIGFTATPNRGDNVRLDDVFEDIIFERDLKWGIKHKYLTDINCLQVDIGYDLTKVKRRMGDYDAAELEDAVNQKCMNQGVAEAYRQLAVGQTIIFATSVGHAEAIAAEIPGAVVVSGKTKNRAEIIERFTNREIPCLVNCMVFTEGTDIPLIETVIIARPTTNAALYTQMVGRGLRLSKGKRYLTLIDCVGATGKNNICTAPSLLGIDMKVVPQRNRKKAVGMLTEMEHTVQLLTDTPEAWILATKEIDVFAETHDFDLHNINWKRSFDGSMVCGLDNGESLQLSPMNELGKTDIFYTSPNQEPYLIRRDVPMQMALDMSYRFLVNQKISIAKLWDMNYVDKWGTMPSTEAQRKFIKQLMRKPVNKERYDKSSFDFDMTKLSKYEASIIIDRLLR